MTRMASYMDEEQFAQANEAAARNLAAWRESGAVKTLKYHSADDADVCSACWERHGSIVRIQDSKMGDNLPPLASCGNAQCRCYFRPEEVSAA